MTIPRSLFTFGCSFLLAVPLSAQISFGGEPLGVRAETLGLPRAHQIDLPAVDAAALMAEDAEREAQGLKGPYRFGYNHAVDLDMANSGTWNDLPDGMRLWRLRLHCPGAFSINFVFDDYAVPEGARVFVYNETGAWLGSFTQASAGGAGLMGVSQLTGDLITVAFEAPAAIAHQGRLHISQVTHAYRDILGHTDERGSGVCNINTICPEGDPWQQQISSVAMITVGGNGICTGQLVNNCAYDGTPYFLTANHCVTGANVGNWVFRFNWESPTCTPDADGPTDQTVSGSTLLLNSAGSDVALLQLSSTPPASYNVYYTGWDGTGDMPSTQTCVHHPSGDVKKISFDTEPAGQGSFDGAQCWHIATWDTGTTEFGSSGSGLWNENGLLIGQLFGGEASCSNNVNDYFGRFDLSLPLLTTWLGTCNEVVAGYDPNATVPSLDASIAAFDGIEDSYCNSDLIDPVITLRNLGTTTLTSVAYSFDLDGGPSTNSTWNGALAQGQQTPIALGSMAVPSGAHAFHFAFTAPNGGTDGNLANNNTERDFLIASPGAIVSLNITLDDYGSETTWELQDDGGTVIFTGGPYQDEASGLIVTEDLCLPEGCFTLIMKDGYGDGMCCDFGNGDYEVVDASSAVLVNGNGDFGEQVSTPFCVESVGLDESRSEEQVRLFPNPGNGLFQLELPDSYRRALMRVRDMEGRLVWQRPYTCAGTCTIDLLSLANGRYSLEVEGAHGRALRAFTIAH